MNKDEWLEMEKIVNDEKEKECNSKCDRKYYHYTSLGVLFDILSNDCLWASNVRFSNDLMEEKMMKLNDKSRREDYTISFCSNHDVLSQWRGYCHDGGAEIEFDIRKLMNYSILYADYEKNSKFKCSLSAPLPVIYVNHDTGPEEKRRDIINALENHNIVSEEDVLPYLKNDLFSEELESRLVFSNINGSLSKCIRFRKLSNKVMVPYIVIKYGYDGQMKGECEFDVSLYDENKLKEHCENLDPIRIPEGNNQEEKYYQLIERIEEFKKNNPDYIFKDGIKVYCNGHLPINQITVAPTYDKDRIAEQIELFCKSKYWLRNVVVKTSDIPYIKPLV